MRRTIGYGLLCLAALALSLSVPGQVSAAQARGVPRESFLEYRADTVEALALQAEQNPQVRARYARHFGIPGSRVAQFIRENLVVSYLPATARYSVYYVRPGGRIVCRQVTLQRGTRVLALRNGEPVLRWICGNAMVPELPEVAVLPVREVPPVPPAVISVPVEQVAMVPRVISVPFEQVAVRQIIPPAPVPAAPVPVAPVPIPVARAAAVVPVVTPAPVPAPVPPRPTSLIPIVAAVPPITFVGGERPVPPVITELPPPEIPVPEPGTLTMLTLAAGPMALAALRRRKEKP